MDDVRDQIEKLVEIIKEKFPTEEVYLFGSFAYGKPNSDSDIDLCVITKPCEKRKIDMMRDIRRAIAPVMTFPVDILLYTKDEFYDRASERSTLEYKIINEGVRIYGC